MLNIMTSFLLKTTSSSLLKLQDSDGNCAIENKYERRDRNKLSVIFFRNDKINNQLNSDLN